MAYVTCEHCEANFKGEIPRHSFNGATCPGSPFDFDAWRTTQAAKRERTRSELTRLLNCGLTICESNGGGILIDWTIYNHQSPAIRRIHSAHLNGSTFPHPAFVDDPACNSPEFLATHLENRSYGFGWSLDAYCVDCGENTIPLAEVQDDPVCQSCDAKRKAYAEINAEADRIESALSSSSHSTEVDNGGR